MTKKEFIKAWNNYELNLEFAEFASANYPDHVTVDDFEEYMVTE